MTSDWLTEHGRDALWFSAKLRFELTENGSERRDYEDRIYLFQSGSADEAETKAGDVGRQHEHAYHTEDGKRLRWRFVEAVKVSMAFLDTPLERGIEIYSERVTSRSAAS